MEDFVSTDTLATAAGYVSREFGCYGYSVRVVSTGFVNTLFELRAGDGGRRMFLCDRYGNVALAPEDLDSERDDYYDWCREAANRLYGRRNGYATVPTATALFG